MKIVRICAALSVAALGASVSLATAHSQQTAPAPAASTVSAPAAIPAADQPSREEVIKLMDAMHIRAQLESLKKSMATQMKQMIDQTMHSQPSMTAEQKSSMEKAYDEGANLYPVSEMMDDMIPIYQRHISKADVAGIITFYNSPSGQHLLTESPAMMKDSMGIVMPKVRARMQTYMQKMQKSSADAAPKPGPASTKTDAPAAKTDSASPKTDSPAPKPDAPVSH